MAERLAIEGGPKAVKPLKKPLTSKIHVGELVELLDLWEYPDGVKKTIVDLLRKHAPAIRGPHLFRYYNPRPSKVAAAERAMAKLIGVRHCLAVNSCTSALIASLRALGIGMGDEVIVPAYTFFASAAVVCACNAVPVIADVDQTLTIDPVEIEKKITPRTKAVIAVHMRGWPARMDRIVRIARKHGIAVIEDVAQAGGASFKGKMLGSIGTMGCFSFDYYKIMNSGEGGFVTTDDEWLYTRAQSWHDCAACWRPNRYASERKEGELFCGENYRMSELQGAVALAQTRQGPKFIRGYRRAKRTILDRLDIPSGVKLHRSHDPEGDAGTCLAFFLPDIESAKWAMKAMKAEGVPAGGVYDQDVKDWHIYVHWEHILEMKAVAPDNLPWSGVKRKDLPAYGRDMCPRALDLLARAVTVTTHWQHSPAHCKTIAKGINKVLAHVK